MHDVAVPGDVSITGQGIKSNGLWKALAIVRIKVLTEEEVRKMPVAGDFSSQDDAIKAGICAGVAELNRQFSPAS